MWSPGTIRPSIEQQFPIPAPLDEAAVVRHVTNLKSGDYFYSTARKPATRHLFNGLTEWDLIIRDTCELPETYRCNLVDSGPCGELKEHPVNRVKMLADVFDDDDAAP